MPINDGRIWYLLVVDIDQQCGWVLNPEPQHSVYHTALDMFEAVCQCLLLDTETWELSFMRGLSGLVDR